MSRIPFRALAATLLLAASAGLLSAQEIGAVRFLANYVPPSGGGYTAGCWGWTDTATGREYAILGNYSGTAIVEITDLGNIVERDFVPGPSSSWREVITHGHYAYVVSEGGGGTQIIDLSFLPDSVHLVRSYIYSASGKSTNRAHTVHARDGFLYLLGCAQWAPGGVLIFDLADPENPVFTGEYSGRYVHDAFVRNDTIFAAAIYNGGGLDIIDATNKYAPQYLYTISYAGSGTHNAATTVDGRYALTTDEIGTTPKTLKIWDLSTPPVFPLAAEYAGSPSAIVHNVFVKESLAIMSYYTAGIRIVDITDPENPVQLGGYDTRPLDESSSYTGAWSVYPFFPSGKIIIGDMGNGMFIVDMNTAAPRPPTGVTASSDYSTPTAATLAWTDPTLTVAGDTLAGLQLHLYRDGAFLAAVAAGVESYTDSGLTLHQLYQYAIVAVSGADSSTAVTRTVYAGGAAQPAKPSGFRVVDLSDGVRLEWVNPSTQIDGTPLNDLEAIEIWRDGALVDAVVTLPADTGAAASWTDSTLGYHGYRIRARDSESPTYHSAYTDSILGYGGLLTAWSEGFEGGVPLMITTGAWDTTRTIAWSGSASLTDSPGGNYPNNSDTWLISPRIVIASGMSLTFRHIAIILGSDFGFVEITRNRGQSYIPLRGFNSFAHAEWQDGSADPGDWFGETVSLASYAGDTVAFRFRLRSDATNNADGWYIDDIAVGPTVGVEEGDGTLPARFALHQNSPNPFNPSTVIRFDLPARSEVRLAVYDVLGREVTLLASGTLEAGPHRAAWDGRTGDGAPAGSGVYFYRLTAKAHDGSLRTDEKRMLLIK